MTRPLPKHAYEQSELEQLREAMRGVKSKDEAMRNLQKTNALLQNELAGLLHKSQNQSDTITRLMDTERMFSEMCTLETVVIADGETHYLTQDTLREFLQMRCFGAAAVEKERKHEALLEMMQVQINAPSLPVNPDIMRMLERSMLQTNQTMIIKKDKPLWPLPQNPK